MFEYLMPELFLPLYRDSLLYESGKFCLYAQKRRRFAGKPWGMSESAYYSLDPALSYRYKAHGARRSRSSAVRTRTWSSRRTADFSRWCLSRRTRQRTCGGWSASARSGRWGFIEALDFTPGAAAAVTSAKRCCHMAHHAGMSVIAAANAVCGGEIQRRFMADGAMAAYSPAC